MRAGVTKSVFFNLFPTVEACYRAAYEQGVDRLSRVVVEAAGREQTWLDRVRAGLVALLGFFDDEPLWARVLVLETPIDGASMLECRQGLYEVLVRVIDQDGAAGAAASSPVLVSALTGELVVGGVFSVIRTSMFDDGDGKLVELAPSLMAFIVAPHLGRVAARAELEGKPAGASATALGERGAARAQAISRTVELPIRATYRTTLVLRAIAQAPYSNNREVAQAAGLLDEGQASKLLARLERRGVIENVGVGAARGEPNAWLLTASGRGTVELLSQSFAAGAPKPRRVRTKGAR